MLVRIDGRLIGSCFEKNGSVAIHFAAELGHVSVIEALVRLGSTTSQNKHGRTPFHFAAQFGHVSALETLVRLGSKAIDNPNKTGLTPLGLAIRSDRNQAILSLKALGANVDIPTNRFSAEEIEQLKAPVDEDEVAEVRYRVYFGQSLVHRLLFELELSQ